jgi:hypothetical protein
MACSDDASADPLTTRVADKCGLSPADIHYSGQRATFGPAEIHQWRTADGSRILTVSRKLDPPSGWRVQCGDDRNSQSIQVRSAELEALRRQLARDR